MVVFFFLEDIDFDNYVLYESKILHNGEIFQSAILVIV